MTGLYLMLLFRIAFANACVGVVLYGWLAYLRRRGRTQPPAALKLMQFINWFGLVAFWLLVVLGFWPFDRSWMNDFFHSLNRALHIF